VKGGGRAPPLSPVWDEVTIIIITTDTGGDARKSYCWIIEKQGVEFPLKKLGLGRKCPKLGYLNHVASSSFL
jgi:hypothetical protein